MARASRIQDKLNSNELKSDWPIWKHATPVLSCFRRALEIDGSNLCLWIEYGTMSYALHAFASRQLKQWRGDLPSELVQQVRRGLEALLRTLRLPVRGAGVGLEDQPSYKHPKFREACGARAAVLLDSRARHPQCRGAGSCARPLQLCGPTLVTGRQVLTACLGLFSGHQLWCPGLLGLPAVMLAPAPAATPPRHRASLQPQRW